MNAKAEVLVFTSGNVILLLIGFGGIAAALSLMRMVPRKARGELSAEL